MIFRKSDGNEEKATQQRKELEHSAADVPMTGKVLETQVPPDPVRVIRQPNEAPTDSDPISADLIRRVLAAIDGWKRDNNLNSLPPRIAFEQALSILNALDRNFPHQE